MTRFIRIRTVLLAAAALFAAAPALAQGQRDPILPGEPNYPGPGPNPGPFPPPSNCSGWASEVTVDPSRPRSGTNYHSIGGALCAVKSSAAAPGAITVSSYGGRPYREEFTVAKSGVMIRAELGETVVVAPPRARCVSIASTSTTTIRGFAFRPSAGTSACIDVKAGTLVLGNSRIDLPDAAAIAIRVSAGASLDFTGDSYDRHGIFRKTAPGLPQGTVGVRAEAASSIKLNNVRIENLAAGVESRAAANDFTRVRFTGNLTAVSIFDESGPAPALTVAGGEFLGSSTAVRFIAGAPGADRANPFRGKVTIGATNDRVLFYRNVKAFETDASGFVQTLEITNADFTENFVHALKFPLPRGATATIKTSTFHGNGRAITITGPLAGALHVDGDIVGGEQSRGIEVVYGAGTFDAALGSVSGQALALGGAFLDNGTHNVVIAQPAGPELLAVSPESSLCQAGARGDWKAFRTSLAALKITVDEQQYIKLISGSSRPSKKKLREAYYIVCSAEIPEDEE